MKAKLEFGFFDDVAMTDNYIFWTQYALACNSHGFKTVQFRRTLAIPGRGSLSIEVLIVRRSKRNQLRCLKTG